jgi:ElaB/YqjD/DUF883 family membrane-anchored ribosome-binding protein
MEVQDPTDFAEHHTVDSEATYEPGPARMSFVDRIFDFTNRARRWTVDNPLPAVGIAVLVGFAMGRLVRR